MTNVPHIYYAVPGHYDIGTRHESLREAVAEAESKIKPIEGTSDFTRSFVDVRVEDGAGDRSVYRFEVTL